MERVTNHLRQKISEIPGSNAKRECLALMPARETGKSFFTDENGNYWRMFIFISDHRSYEKVRHTTRLLRVEELSAVFVDACRPARRAPAIDNTGLHNIVRQLEAFHRVIAKDSAGEYPRYQRG
ncbi:MAG: hypothetical protein U5L72_11595 [Bacteroidales bacterium]|nr:hypothetical protein [Bacteroidales bacterium]